MTVFRFMAVFLQLSFFIPLIWAQSEKGWIPGDRVPDPRPHYLAEYAFDQPTDPEAWECLGSGLFAGFGTTNEHYMRCELPEGVHVARKWEATGWRGERMNTQLLIWSAVPQMQVRLQAGNLVSTSGEIIEKKQVSLKLVRYVISDFPYDAGGFSCDTTPDQAWLMPDRLEHFEHFDLPGKSVRPVWISVDVPYSAIPGDYRGYVIVKTRNTSDTLRISLKVQNQVLPTPENWHFRLDLWQNPSVVAKYFQVEPWSEEHLLLLKKHLAPYAGAGGKYITTYAIHSPWSDNSYTLEGSMIEWVKTEEGNWQFDYSRFDTYVTLCREMGIGKYITLYTPVPWGFRFRYLDRASGDYVYESWEPSSPEFKKHWTAFLDDFMSHLDRRGWFQDTYLGINENPLEVTLSAMEVIREHSERWKVTYAGNWHSELSPKLEDYCTIISNEPSPGELVSRKENGFTSTFYVCCYPPKPNNFVFSPPVESRFMGWYAASCGYDGFLRWAYDAWPADPQRDARHTLWPAGDCFLVYPGGQSSIRFEKLREGIVDFEKMRILLEKASLSTEPEVKELDAKLKDILLLLSNEHDYHKRKLDKTHLIRSLDLGNSLINELSEALAEQ